MPALIITGGVATGKSTVLRMIQAARQDAEVFDCDREVHKALTEAEILEQVRRQFGEGVFEGPRLLDRRELRRRIFSDSGSRRALENILHPVIAERYRVRLSSFEKSAKDRADIFVGDVPLFYESNQSFAASRVVVVAATMETEVCRLMARDHLTELEATGMIRSQMSITEKMVRADVVLWNDGPLERLDEQVDLLIRQLLGGPVS